MKTITKHYIDGAFVESHGGKVMQSINPTNQEVLGSVMLGDEEDARRARAAVSMKPCDPSSTRCAPLPSETPPIQRRRSAFEAFLEPRAILE